MCLKPLWNARTVLAFFLCSAFLWLVGLLLTSLILRGVPSHLSLIPLACLSNVLTHYALYTSYVINRPSLFTTDEVHLS